MKKIPLTQGYFAMVDDEDYDVLIQFRWSLSSGCNDLKYATSSQSTSMHRVIMNAKKGQIVDHIDHNGLNNQKENLRICTSSENQKNKRAKKNGTSKYLGVHYHQKSKSWKVAITYNGSRIELGYFKQEEDAAKAYDAAAKKYHGDFANLNFKEEKMKQPVEILENEEFVLGTRVFTYYIKNGTVILKDTGKFLQSEIQISELVSSKKLKPKSNRRRDFSAPTLIEFKEYFKVNGFKEDVAERAWNGYNVAEWHKSNGDKILNWKQTCFNVWFKEENRATPKQGTNDSFFNQEF